MRIFSENLLMNLTPFIHAYLHNKNQSEILLISEILTIKEYWNLTGREPFLAIFDQLENQVFPKHAVFAEC